MKIDTRKEIDFYLSNIDKYLLKDKDSFFQIVDEKLWDAEFEGYDEYDEKITEIVAEVYSEIEFQRETNPSELESIFQQACLNASDKKDESIYVEFCLLLGNKAPINVWHVKQNMLKNYTNGKKTLRELCLSDYCEEDRR